MTKTTVNLIGSAATLLSARRLSDCQSSDDVSCDGGVAAVAALARLYSKGAVTLVLPRLDLNHEFVQAHPLGWNVNTAVLHEHFQWNVVTSFPSLLTEGAPKSQVTASDPGDSTKEEVSPVFQTRQKDVAGLQIPSMSLLMSNVALPPSNSFHPYVQSVHFQQRTRLALIALEEEVHGTNSVSYSQVETAWSCLNYIAAENKRQNCTENNNLEAPIETLISDGDGNTTTATSRTTNRCWIPVVMVYKSSSPQSFDSLVAKVSDHEQPPALIVDWEGVQAAFSTPKVNTQSVWIVSKPLTADSYLQLQITFDLDTLRVQDLIVVQEDLKELPETAKDEQYEKDIKFLRNLADEAIAHDPILGNSNAMPRADTEQCRQQECEMGNLVADSLRWWQSTSRNGTSADVAFLPGNSITGPGWSFGQVHVSDVWKAMPTPMTICTGEVKGSSLLQVLDRALQIGPNGEESGSVDPQNGTGQPFLQVSGLQVVYSPNLLVGNTSQLVSVKVWDEKVRSFLNLNPVRMYKFTTESTLCDDQESSFASLLRDDNRSPTLENSLFQTIVGEYLGQLGTTYVPLLDDRLTKDTSNNTSAFDFDSITGSCPEGTYWDGKSNLCQSCPDPQSHVSLSDSLMSFHFQNYADESQTGRVVMLNRDVHDYLVVSQDIPTWFEFTRTDSSEATLSGSSTSDWPDVPLTLASGERFAFDFAINTSEVVVGTTFDIILFNITTYESLPECNVESYSLTLGTMLQVDPPNEAVGLDVHAVVGLVLMGHVLFACVALASWVFLKRERWGYSNLGDKSLKSIQPLYLATICFGVLVMALTVAALSVVNVWLCLVAPWMFSLGLTTVFAALLSKLTTASIIRPEQAGSERTIQMSVKDLFKPFIALFTVNFTLLLMMLIEPPTMGQQAVDGEYWKYYDVCEYTDLDWSLLLASGIVHLLSFGYTCYKAYRVSLLKEQFHELQNITLSLFLWFQIAAIGIPTWFTLDAGNMIGQYYFKVVAICLLSTSMLLCIFVPVITEKYEPTKSSDKRSNVEKEEEHGNNVFGGFLGFSKSFSVNSRGIPEDGEEYHDEDNDHQFEQRNGCMVDKVCW
jgi:7 transmembrane sweet-taste receptor of 3 GCPR/5'-nucleotidase, C-terminal domain